MLTEQLYFDLPEELIAQYPRENHDSDRLLCIDRRTGAYSDHLFTDIPSLLPKSSILILNDTRVRKARVYAISDSGSQVELLFISPLPEGKWKCISNRLKRRKVGEHLYITVQNASKIALTVDGISHQDGTLTISSDEHITEEFFEKSGHIPLPPYIKREDEFSDEKSYQTIFSSHLGSVASPTSGLHYTQKVLDAIAQRGIEILKITLHVGLGTFLPLRTATLEEHKMHSEHYNITPAVAERITEQKHSKLPVIASGTTVVRTLESAWDGEKIIPASSSTDIFITPGFNFRVIDGLITNFHTPKSTLLSLVSAFSSLDIVKSAYAHAISERYHFFSYGDCTYFY